MTRTCLPHLMTSSLVHLGPCTTLYSTPIGHNILLMLKDGPATPLKFLFRKEEETRDCQHAVGGLLRFFREKCPHIKEKSKVVNLDKPTPQERLLISTLKKHLGISSDSDQPGIPGMEPVRVKGKVLWLCYQHATASLPHANQDSAPSVGMSGTLLEVSAQL